MFFFLLVLGACLEKKQMSVRGGEQMLSLTRRVCFVLGAGLSQVHSWL